jgi:hypothetical protein
MSLLGVKRTWLVAAHMSADDPKRTLMTDDPGRADWFFLILPLFLAKLFRPATI